MQIRQRPPIQAAMFRLGYMQADVAQEMGVSESAMSRIARNRVIPKDLEFRKRLADLLQTSETKLWPGNLNQAVLPARL